MGQKLAGAQNKHVGDAESFHASITGGSNSSSGSNGSGKKNRMPTNVCSSKPATNAAFAAATNNTAALPSEKPSRLDYTPNIIQSSSTKEKTQYEFNKFDNSQNIKQRVNANSQDISKYEKNNVHNYSKQTNNNKHVSATSLNSTNHKQCHLSNMEQKSKEFSQSVKCKNNEQSNINELPTIKKKAMHDKQYPQQQPMSQVVIYESGESKSFDPQNTKFKLHTANNDDNAQFIATTTNNVSIAANVPNKQIVHTSIDNKQLILTSSDRKAERLLNTAQKRNKPNQIVTDINRNDSALPVIASSTTPLTNSRTKKRHLERSEEEHHNEKSTGCDSKAVNEQKADSTQRNNLHNKAYVNVTNTCTPNLLTHVENAAPDRSLKQDYDKRDNVTYTNNEAREQQRQQQQEEKHEQEIMKKENVWLQDRNHLTMHKSINTRNNGNTTKSHLYKRNMESNVQSFDLKTKDEQHHDNIYNRYNEQSPTRVTFDDIYETQEHTALTLSEREREETRRRIEWIDKIMKGERFSNNNNNNSNGSYDYSENAELSIERSKVEVNAKNCNNEAKKKSDNVPHQEQRLLMSALFGNSTERVSEHEQSNYRKKTQEMQKYEQHQQRESTRRKQRKPVHTHATTRHKVDFVETAATTATIYTNISHTEPITSVTKSYNTDNNNNNSATDKEAVLEPKCESELCAKNINDATTSQDAVANDKYYEKTSTDIHKTNQNKEQLDITISNNNTNNKNKNDDNVNHVERDASMNCLSASLQACTSYLLPNLEVQLSEFLSEEQEEEQHEQNIVDSPDHSNDNRKVDNEQCNTKYVNSENHAYTQKCDENYYYDNNIDNYNDKSDNKINVSAKEEEVDITNESNKNELSITKMYNTLFQYKFPSAAHVGVDEVNVNKNANITENQADCDIPCTRNAQENMNCENKSENTYDDYTKVHMRISNNAEKLALHNFATNNIDNDTINSITVTGIPNNNNDETNVSSVDKQRNMVLSAHHLSTSESSPQPLQKTMEVAKVIKESASSSVTEITYYKHHNNVKIRSQNVKTITKECVSNVIDANSSFPSALNAKAMRMSYDINTTSLLSSIKEHRSMQKHERQKRKQEYSYYTNDNMTNSSSAINNTAAQEIQSAQNNIDSVYNANNTNVVYYNYNEEEMQVISVISDSDDDDDEENNSCYCKNFINNHNSSNTRKVMPNNNESNKDVDKLAVFTPPLHPPLSATLRRTRELSVNKWRKVSELFSLLAKRSNNNIDSNVNSDNKSEDINYTSRSINSSCSNGSSKDEMMIEHSNNMHNETNTNVNAATKKEVLTNREQISNDNTNDYFNKKSFTRRNEEEQYLQYEQQQQHSEENPHLYDNMNSKNNKNINACKYNCNDDVNVVVEEIEPNNDWATYSLFNRRRLLLTSSSETEHLSSSLSKSSYPSLIDELSTEQQLCEKETKHKTNNELNNAKMNNTNTKKYQYKKRKMKKREGKELRSQIACKSSFMCMTNASETDREKYCSNGCNDDDDNSISSDSDTTLHFKTENSTANFPSCIRLGTNKHMTKKKKSNSNEYATCCYDKSSAKYDDKSESSANYVFSNITKDLHCNSFNLPPIFDNNDNDHCSNEVYMKAEEELSERDNDDDDGNYNSISSNSSSSRSTVDEYVYSAINYKTRNRRQCRANYIEASMRQYNHNANHRNMNFITRDLPYHMGHERELKHDVTNIMTNFVNIATINDSNTTNTNINRTIGNSEHNGQVLILNAAMSPGPFANAHQCVDASGDNTPQHNRLYYLRQQQRQQINNLDLQKCMLEQSCPVVPHAPNTPSPCASPANFRNTRYTSIDCHAINQQATNEHAWQINVLSTNNNNNNFVSNPNNNKNINTNRAFCNSSRQTKLEAIFQFSLADVPWIRSPN